MVISVNHCFSIWFINWSQSWTLIYTLMRLFLLGVCCFSLLAIFNHVLITSCSPSHEWFVFPSHWMIIGIYCRSWICTCWGKEVSCGWWCCYEKPRWQGSNSLNLSNLLLSLSLSSTHVNDSFVLLYFNSFVYHILSFFLLLWQCCIF